MMHACMMQMYVACKYDPRPLTLMHVSMVHIPMILGPDACVYDAGMNDAYIMVLDPDAHINDAGLFRYRRTNKLT